MLLFLTAAAPQSFEPAQSGYKLIFDDEFNSAATIDMADSRSPGFNWYRTGFFGARSTPTRDISIAGGVLTLTGADRAMLASAVPAPHAPGWHGRTFGGGFYIEARIAFDPDQPTHVKAWPAFWSMAVEHLQGVPAGTEEHFIEDDFFEDDTTSFTNPNSYGGAIHDWYGVPQQTCPHQQFCDITNNGSSPFHNFVIRVPPATNWRQFHDFGQLWVPATPGHPGFVRYYFDGLPTTDQVTWPPGTSATVKSFGIIDQDHLVIVLSTGTQTMRVKSVKIWQVPSQADDESR